MIIVCQNCSTRLQVAEGKSPARPFSIRCPKCNHTVNSGSDTSPGGEQGALAVGGSPSTDHPRFDRAAPVYELESEAGPEKNPATEDAIRLLASLLSTSGQGDLESIKGASRKRRKVLVCASEQLRDSIARGLAESSYQVFVAEDTRQAVERMRSNQLEVVILEPQFDAVEQGAAFVVREINVLRPAQRRRLFFVLLSPSLRTMDAHSAFLNNVNAVVNINDVGDMPRILEVALREYNELYKEFHIASNVAAL
jgi:predicted Zn finger-like uncharacterized protein